MTRLKSVFITKNIAESGALLIQRDLLYSTARSGTGSGKSRSRVPNPQRFIGGECYMMIYKAAIPRGESMQLDLIGFYSVPNRIHNPRCTAPYLAPRGCSERNPVY